MYAVRLTYMGKTILFNLESTQPSISGKRHGGGIYGEILFKRMVELNADMAAFYTSEKWMNPLSKNSGNRPVPG